jgi:hypothetical protein
MDLVEVGWGDMDWIGLAPDRDRWRALVDSVFEVEVEVTLRLTVSQPICLGIDYLCRTRDQILFPVGMLLYEICCLVSIGRPL